ncbi:putative quinol monooxygenase [Chitinimonas sp.]|uniref:putative quinol monooxygenase n=1 Tax=Chitinimonas sp. TaxID=1934313 RepID=UPI002F94CDFF
MSQKEVRLTAVLRAQPGKEAELEATLRKLATEVRGEPGCVQYTLHANPAEPGEFVFYEIWADQAALDQHAQAPALQAVRGPFELLLREPPLLTFLQVLS